MADDNIPVLRRWGDLSDGEQSIIKLLYINGVHSLPQIARIWRINYNGLNQVNQQREWTKEKRETEVSIQQNLTEHTKFMQRVHGMMENIHHGYEELMVRHQLADTFEAFPFDTYYSFLETYAKLVNSLGGVKPVSPDMHLHLQQNLQSNTLNINDGVHALLNGPAIASITDKNAKIMLTKVIENIVLTSRPPQPAELTTEVVKPENKPDPARGIFR